MASSSSSSTDPKTVRVRKKDLAKLLTCSICNNIFNDPVITECFHIFCNRCIHNKITKENLNNCPVCSVLMDNLRRDHGWSSIRATIAPFLGKVGKVDDEHSSGEAEQSITSPARRKKKRLFSLVNKRNVFGPYSFGRKRKANGRKVFPYQGSNSPIDNPHKSVAEHPEGSRLKSVDNNKQILHNFSVAESSKQQTSRKDRERNRKSEKQIESVSNLLKPLTEEKDIRNYDKTAIEGVLSSKAMDIAKHEAKSSGKNLRSFDVSTRPVRKTRSQTKKMDETQGINFHGQTFADTASNQHAKRVAPVWLSLVSSVNQEGEPLPQIPHCYTMIKDATLPISLIKKYLSQKLGLDSEDEVEISLCGSPLPSDLALHAVVDLWLQSMSKSEKYSAKVGDSAKNFVMVLSYGRNSKVSAPA